MKNLSILGIAFLSVTLVSCSPNQDNATSQNLSSSTSTISSASPDRPDHVTASSISSMTSTTAGSTFVDSQFHFSLSYQNDFADFSRLTSQQKQQTASYLAQDCQHVAQNLIPANSRGSICYVGAATDMDAAYITVSASSVSPTSVCPTEVEMGADLSNQLTAHGLTFIKQKNDAEDVGLGNRIKTELYNASANGKCFTIYLTVSWHVGDYGDDLTAVNAMFARLRAIASSFRLMSAI